MKPQASQIRRDRLSPAGTLSENDGPLTCALPPLPAVPGGMAFLDRDEGGPAGGRDLASRLERRLDGCAIVAGLRDPRLQHDAFLRWRRPQVAHLETRCHAAGRRVPP